MTTIPRPPPCLISEEDKILFTELLNYFDLFTIVLKTDNRFIKYFKQFSSVFPLISFEVKLQFIYFTRQVFHKVYTTNFEHFKQNTEAYALAIFKTALYFENPMTRPILGSVVYELTLAFFGAQYETLHNRANLIFEKLCTIGGLYDYSSLYGYCNKVATMFSNDFLFLSGCLTIIQNYVKDYMEYDLKHIATTVIIQEHLKSKGQSITRTRFEENLRYVTNHVFPNNEETVVQSILYFAEDFLAADFLFDEVVTTDTTDDVLSSFFMDDNSKFDLDNSLMDDIFGMDSSQGGYLSDAI